MARTDELKALQFLQLLHIVATYHKIGIKSMIALIDEEHIYIYIYYDKKGALIGLKREHMYIYI